MNTTLTFKRLCEAAVTMGEMDEGTADYFHGLYLNSDEHREVQALREALRNLVDAVNVEFPGGMRDIGGKTGVALIQAVNVLAKPGALDQFAAVLEAQKHNHEKPLRLD